MKLTAKQLISQIDSAKNEKQNAVVMQRKLSEQIKKLEADLAYKTHHTRLTGKIIESVWMSKSSDCWCPTFIYAFCLDDGVIVVTQKFNYNAKITKPLIGKVIRSSFSNSDCTWTVKTESGGSLRLRYYSGFNKQQPIVINFKNKLDGRLKWKQI
jgi:hypothetical protein